MNLIFATALVFSSFFNAAMAADPIERWKLEPTGKVVIEEVLPNLVGKIYLLVNEQRVGTDNLLEGSKVDSSVYKPPFDNDGKKLLQKTCLEGDLLSTSVDTGKPCEENCVDLPLPFIQAHPVEVTFTVENPFAAVYDPDVRGRRRLIDFPFPNCENIERGKKRCNRWCNCLRRNRNGVTGCKSWQGRPDDFECGDPDIRFPQAVPPEPKDCADPLYQSTLIFCVRADLWHTGVGDPENFSTSFVDTYIEVTLNHCDNTFVAEVLTANEDIETSAPVQFDDFPTDAFQCDGVDHKAIDVPVTDGQDFHVCVKPEPDFEQIFVVHSFNDDVWCANYPPDCETETPLDPESCPPDGATWSLKRKIIPGIDGIDSVETFNKKKVDPAGILMFTSVAVSDYFNYYPDANNDPPPELWLYCWGTVNFIVRKTRRALRNMEESIPDLSVNTRTGPFEVQLEYVPTSGATVASVPLRLLAVAAVGMWLLHF